MKIYFYYFYVFLHITLTAAVCARLRRDAEPQCGTDSTPADGSACQDGPGWEEQHVCGMCGVIFDTSYPIGAHTWSMP